jgi:hypothetical protein
MGTVCVQSCCVRIDRFNEAELALARLQKGRPSVKSVVIDTPGQVRVETLPDPTMPGADGAVIQGRGIP